MKARMSQSNCVIAEIGLPDGTKFSIAHNLEELGLSIDAAVTNWYVRTEKFTAQNLCEYIESKDPLNIIATPDCPDPIEESNQ